MSTGSIEKFQIFGYFSRIFARKPHSVRVLTSEVHTSQEEAFKTLRKVYKTFNRAKTHDNSRALAKQIVKIAIQKAADPRWEGVDKTRQLTNAVLSSWLRDGKRDTLVTDIRAELRMQLRAFWDKQEVDHEIVAFKQSLSLIQGESTEPLTRILQEKRRVKAEEMAPSIKKAKEERAELEAELKSVQCSIDRFKSLPRPPKPNAEVNPPGVEVAWPWKVVLDDDEIQEDEQLVPEYQEYNEARRQYLEELIPRKNELLNAIKEYAPRLDDLFCPINRYDLDGISSRAKNIIDRASKKGITVTPEELVPDTLPAESRGTLIQAIQSFHSTRESRVIPKERIKDKLDKEFQVAQLAMNRQEDGEFKYELPEQEVPHEEKPSLNAGVAFMKGKRPGMEDDHLMAEFLIKDQPARLFGVFDGHGGSEVSRFVRENLQAYLERNLDKFGTTQEGVFNALKTTFVELDQDVPAEWELAGTTASVAFIYDGKIWVANSGDSRTVLNNDGTPVQLSEDAKPSMEKYRRGVEKRRGVVKGSKYVEGAVAVARSIGDHEVKGKGQHCCISPRPKIVQISEEKGTHLILACDGLWDVASTGQVVRAVQEDDGSSPGEIAQKLVWSAYSAGSGDNISAMVIKLRTLQDPDYIHREFRYVGEDKIKGKLDKEFRDAQLQMASQEDNALFKYKSPKESSMFREEPPSYEDEPSLNAAVAFDQGRKHSMEDDHLMAEFLIKDQPARLFGVFDGHGGSKVSRFVRENLQTCLTKNLKRFGTTQDGIFNALKTTFVELDQAIPKKWDGNGTTATVAFIYDGKIWVANTGDSRTVLDDSGSPVQLSEDAKPEMEKYKRGIEKRGGIVALDFGMRVNGVLAMARSIGDHQLTGRRQHRCVSPRPKITQVSEKKGNHLILASDGLWDVASTGQIVRAVNSDKGSSPSEIAQKLVVSAYEARSRDNTSAMVIRL